MFSGLAHINTASSRSFSHGVTFAVDLAVFTNIVQFAVHKTTTARKAKPFWLKWGPVICLVWATILADADLVRHLINDAWGTICTSTEPSQSLALCDRNGQCKELEDKYKKYCYSQPMMNQFHGGEGFPHESVYGWIFSIFCTWLGYILLFVGIFWVINFPQKIRAQWRTMQRTRQRRQMAATDSRRTPLAPLA